jgi:hypothetical protein
MSRWERGTSGNVLGRPKSASIVARAVAERTNGGAEIVERVLAIARGEDRTMCSASVRWAAIEWCSDRLWGRAAQSIELTAPDAPAGARFSDLDDANLSTDEMRELVTACDRIAELQAKARRPALKTMPLHELEPIAVAAGQSEEQAREGLRQQHRELRSMPLVAAGEEDPDAA